MMRLWGAKVLLALVVVAATAVPASSNPFVKPPEIYAPAWESSFPYQRNVDWDFATNPVGGPSPGGTPGAHYEGWADEVLRVSDFVAVTGDMGWAATVPSDGVNPYLGVMAIDNRNGVTAQMGTIVFHLDNFVSANPRKHVWIEAFAFWTDAVASVTIQAPNKFSIPGAAFLFDPWSADPALDIFDYWYSIQPNPPWEEIVVDVVVQPGGYFVLDRLHVATECVPEPSSLVLGAIGLVSMAGVGWRKRRRLP